MRYHAIILSLGLVLSFQSNLHADGTCAKVSAVEGTQCPNLKVKFDLAGCKDTAVSDVVVVCAAGKATATVKSKNFQYSAIFEETDAWGKKTYVTSGGVIQSGNLKQPVAQKKETRGMVRIQPAQKITEIPKVEKTAAREEVTSSSPDIQFGGNFDLFYAYNFNKPRSSSLTVSPPATNIDKRYYDSYHNQFGLNLAELTVKRTSGEVGFNLEVGFGESIDANHAGVDATGAAFIDETSKHIEQAFVTYTPENGRGFSLSAGKMYTHIGYEVPKAKDNWQYSRSYIYGFAIPVWHTGLAANFPVYDEKLYAGLYLYNGWNSLYDNNDGKTYGLQLKYTPSDKLTMIYNLITGPEKDEDNGDWRTINEVNAVLAASPRINLALEVLYGFEPSIAGGGERAGKWFGTSFHAKFNTRRNYWFSLRGEYFRDINDVRIAAGSGKGENIFSGTLTAGLDITDGLGVRTELRGDRSRESAIFTDEDGEKRQTQTTLAAALLYSF